MPAQGELRGPKPHTEGNDAEDQYAGGDASVDAAEHNGSVIFTHTVASRAYRRELADRNWHEVWVREVPELGMLIREGRWALKAYKHATTGEHFGVHDVKFRNPRPGFLPTLIKESA